VLSCRSAGDCPGFVPHPVPSHSYILTNTGLLWLYMPTCRSAMGEPNVLFAAVATFSSLSSFRMSTPYSLIKIFYLERLGPILYSHGSHGIPMPRTSGTFMLFR